MKQLMLLAVLCSTLVCFPQTDEVDNLILKLAYQKQDTSKVEISLDIIELFIEEGDHQKAFQYLDLTQKLAAELNYAKGSANAYYLRAIIYAHRNDYYNASDSFLKARDIFQKLNYDLGVARVNNQLALLEIRRGNYDAGILLSERAISVFEKEQNTEELAMAYTNLGEAYRQTSETNKSLENFLEALSLWRQLQNTNKIQQAKINIGDLYSENNEHRKAIEYYKDVLSSEDFDSENAHKGELYAKIGNEYLEFNDFENAAENLREALNIQRSMDEGPALIRVLNAWGRYNLKRENYRTSQSQLEEATELLSDSTEVALRLENYQLRKLLDSSRGNFENAYNWQSRYFALTQELESKNLPERLSDQVSYTDTALEPANQTNDHRIDSDYNRQGVYIFILLGLLTLAIIALALLYRNNRKLLGSLEEQNASVRELNLEKNLNSEKITHLENINQDKDRIFSIVSHDLKDSISSIKAFIDLLREDSLSREEFYELLPELSENADNAHLLLFNLLNWSKTQMQNLEPNPEIFNIQEVFQEKVRLVENKVEEKRIVIIDETKRDFAYADKNMIEIVIQNLLNNAVKFSRVSDMITIANRDVEGKALITVEDTGVGISEENLKKLFKKKSYTTLGTKQEKGTGLGLSICKELVELNQGRIWVESTLNVGTKFYVELPKTKPE